MTRISRRHALAWALCSAGAACRSGTRTAPSPPTSASAPRPDFGGLEVTEVTQMATAERGGHAVVLLHGYGAHGDDLVSLARELLQPRTRFVLPAAPIAMGNGGRAWWEIDAVDRPRYVTDSAVSTASATSTAALDFARTAVQRVLSSALASYAPDKLSIAGFSQGAMLSLDVALSAPPTVARAALLSGALLEDAAARLERYVDLKPAVFVSHGREDRRLPFSGAERMKTELAARGFDVTWRPFEGGHEIPGDIVRELRQFLFGV